MLFSSAVLDTPVIRRHHDNGSTHLPVRQGSIEFSCSSVELQAGDSWKSLFSAAEEPSQSRDQKQGEGGEDTHKSQFSPWRG